MGFLIQTIFFMCCLTLKAFVTGQEDAPPTVTTKYGILSGKSVSVKETDQKVSAFFGVPFAKAPVGDLRLAPPQPQEPWSGVRDATKPPAMCLQNTHFMEMLSSLFPVEIELPLISEDCLYLNIYTPAKCTGQSTSPTDCKLPVMVSIHGGVLIFGGTPLSPGPALAAHEDVVVVVIQYRLGPLGFISSGIGEAQPGNLGFLDQVEAFKWVKENIGDFGGDPQSVTIYGESAGGLSVASHVLSPLSRGLFHRAIAESGVALMPFLFATTPIEEAYSRNIYAKESGCPPQTLIECLKGKTEAELIAIFKALPVLSTSAMVDGVFLTKTPEELMANKEINNVPFLLGHNEQEFCWLLPKLLGVPDLSNGIDMETVRVILTSLPIIALPEGTLDIVIQEYFDDDDDPFEIRNKFLDLVSDIIFVVPSLRTAMYHRDAGLRTYYYEYCHRPSIYQNIKPAYVKPEHTDELPFVFGGPFLNDNSFYAMNATDEEKSLSRTMMNYWGNFARNGDPNGPGVAVWPAFGEDEAYMKIGLQQESLTNYKKDKILFWTVTLLGSII